MFERRLKVLLIFLTVIAVVLIVRAFSIQVVHHRYWEEESSRAMADESVVATTRGRILDVKGRELAIDQPCIDVCVDYLVIPFEIDPQDKKTRDRVRAMARQRLVQRDEHFIDLPYKRRVALITAEIDQVRLDIDAMWRELARVSGRTNDELDEQRRQIIRLVETRRRLAWYGKYEKALKNQTGEQNDAWYSWLLGKSELSLDKFADIEVAEQTQTHTIIPNVDYAVRNELARQIEKYPGLSLRPGIMRFYPYGSAACHTIGTLRKVEPKELVDRETAKAQTQQERLRNYRPSDEIGRGGLEGMLEDRLRGTRGSRVEDAGGEIVQSIEPKPGEDVRVTIDIELQAQVEAAFGQVKFQPHRDLPVEHLAMPGAAVVIDLATGEVRALASYPTYDLNRFDDLYTKLAQDVINRPFANRALTSELEPGSTVKPIVGLGAITDGLIGARDTIECTGYLVLGGKQYSYGRCWTMSGFSEGFHHHSIPSAAPHPNGFLTFADALERSCNVYHETLGDKLGVSGISRWYDRFGLGRVTGIGLREGKGRLPDSFQGPAILQRSESWFTAIGQGHVSATPIQIANLAATIARGGIWVRPTLLPRRAFVAGDRVDLGLNADAVHEARRGMINVVNGLAGTGTGARMDAILVAGKTGSAQSAPLRIQRVDSSGLKVLDQRGREMWNPITPGTRAAINPLAPWYRASGENEEKVSSHAWMMAFAPADRPTIAIAAMVEYGGGGGTAAGSVIKATLEACAKQGYLRSGQP
ncbi:MAG: hypothetical protein H7144_12405 [Burkholderiales bacterium]|nr:hypothetical protein [Phycisphaerae bacterium]